MPAELPASLTFVAWAKKGLSSGLPAWPESGFPADSPMLDVTVELERKSGSHVSQKATLAVKGPLGVKQLPPGAISRRSPAPDSSEAEPRYLACVEFTDADFPWRYTPASRAPRDRLPPWLALVVLKDDVTEIGATLEPTTEKLGTVVVKSPAQLPDLTFAWAYAHAQLRDSETSGGPLDQRFAAAASQALSRVLCPRPLEPLCAYQAFLVPTFAGAGSALSPAWSTSASEVTLRFFERWAFRTGVAADVPALVRRLSPAARLRAGANAGGEPRVSLDLSAIPGVPAAAPGVEAWGAMKSGTASPTDPWDTHPSRAAFESAVRASTANPKLPLYGMVAAGRKAVAPSGQVSRHWFDRLNLDPRARLAASLGAEVVRRKQDQWVAAAWKQLPELATLQQKLGQTALSRELSRRIFRDHVGTRDTVQASVALLRFSPVLDKTLTGASTVGSRLGGSFLPRGAADPSLRRLARQRGPSARRLGATPGASLWASAFELCADPATSPLAKIPAPLSAGQARLWDAATLGPGANTAPLQVSLPGAPATTTTPGGATGPSGWSLPPAGDLNAVPTVTAAAKTEFATVLLPKLTTMLRAPAPLAVKPRADLAGEAEALRGAIHPTASFAQRWSALVKLDGRKARRSGSDGLSPVLAEPDLDDALFRELVELAPEWMLPGISTLPQDSVSAARVDWRFVEAFLAGANHELARELVWRGYPADLGGSFFRRFWDPRPKQGEALSRDVAHERGWTGSLGSNPDPRSPRVDPLVLVLRSPLFFPKSRVSLLAVQAVPGPDGPRPSSDPTHARPWLFQGSCGADVACFGFDLTDAEARTGGQGLGWMFVLQETPREPGFRSAPTDPAPFGAATSSADLAADRLEPLALVTVHAKDLLGAKP